MKIARRLKPDILAELERGNQVIVLYGPRQTGKTTLMREVIAEAHGKALLLDGDELRHIDILSSRDATKLGRLIEGYDLLFVDEAQRIPDIGLNLKILHDGFPRLKIAITGSSSFDIAQGVAEPLTGRTWSRTLYPLATDEYLGALTRHEVEEGLDERLVLGSYPRLLSLETRTEKESQLAELAGSYLYRDILELSGIRNPRKLRDILKLLAWQIGNEVSLTEIGRQVGMSKDTVQDYLDLLEKSFIIFELGGFGRNLRSEVVRNRKYYFHDNGIRNVVIEDLRPLERRNDAGALWENFCVAERRKFLSYSATLASSWFWRTYDGAEIDYVESRDGKLFAYEFKSGKKSARCPASFNAAYPDSAFSIVTRENWIEFVRGGERETHFSLSTS